jgi:adenine-specific DNA-methyltransferase
MALIEDLIAQVTETALREAIAREVSDLKKRLSWGLTFERHAPEIAWLRHAPVAVGATVIDRRTTLPWRVVAVDGDTLTIEADGATRTIPRIDAFVETRFDEAVYPAVTSLGAIRRGPAERPTHAVAKRASA